MDDFDSFLAGLKNDLDDGFDWDAPTDPPEPAAPEPKRSPAPAAKPDRRTVQRSADDWEDDSPFVQVETSRPRTRKAAPVEDKAAKRQARAQRMVEAGERMQETGQKMQRTGKKITRVVWGVVALIILVILLKSCGGGSDTSKTALPAQDQSAVVSDNVQAQKPAQQAAQIPSGTTGEQNALRSAESYLSFMPFSYDGLIEQLEFDGYSEAEAKYGADNCGADWAAQAARAATNYLSTMPFSYSGLVEQLEFDKYTAEHAEAAVANCGADWMEQAAKAAKNYLNVMSFSRDGLIEQLQFDGYTYEQAVYGAQQNGY